MIGQVLGHYRIEEKIGAGGMGEVFRAHDQRLERDVAVKVLPAHTLDDKAVRSRFRKEALSLSSLNHPNIATVHDFDSQDGIDFLVMEYVPGTTLSDMLLDGPLPQELVLDLASQLSAGLAAAHEQDLIHRDLKPANLRITPDGRLKILDFGLAKLVQQTTGDAATLTMTEAGAVVGTIAYMSPEQLRGQRVDARSDIYSAGAVLYEMATGQRRYEDSQGAALIDSILNHDPKLPRKLNREISEDMENVVLKSLARDPGQRYATTRELGEDLSRLQAGMAVVAQARPRGISQRWVLGLGGVVVLLAVLIALDVGGLRQRWFGGDVVLNTLAVLPMVNLSGDPEEDYLAEGMTRELISELTKIAALQVRPFQSVMRYQETDMTLPEIAKELGVVAVVTASVVSSGNQLHINAQLIDASENKNLWADSFDRGMQDILVFYGEMARTIAAEVRVVVAPEEEARLADARQVDPETYRLFLLGQRFANQWAKEKEGFMRGHEFFMRAIERDSTYAPAYVALALNYQERAVFLEMNPSEAGSLAKAAAKRALELDADLGAAHAVSAAVKMTFDWDFAGADEELRRAIALNPGDPSVLDLHGFALAMEGRFDEAIAVAIRSAEIDPVSMKRNLSVGWRYWWAGRFDEAIDQLNRTVEMDPNYWAPYMELSWCYAEKGMKEEAIANIEIALNLGASNDIVFGSSATVYAMIGMEQEARRILGQLEQRSQIMYVDPLYIAITHMVLGDHDRVIELLRECLEVRSASVPFIKHGRWVDPLRADPRFQEILELAFGGG